jgi:predicted dehydrogenase
LTIRYRTLLVGLGQIGCGYDAHLPFLWDEPGSSPRTLTHARAIACHPGFELVGGVDPIPAARTRFVRIYGRPAYANLSECFVTRANQSLDVVVISVPPQFQPGLVKQLLGLVRPRLLLLEKPVATKVEQSNAIEQICGMHPDMVVAVNYIRCYLSAVQKWKIRIQAGQLGRLICGQITYGKGLMTNGSHFVNLAEAWLGPMQFYRVQDEGSACLGFDREVSLELHALNHSCAPVLVRSVGEYGLRAGEVDLWFEGGRLCWQNSQNNIVFWRRASSGKSDDYVSLSEEPEYLPTAIDHYQHQVLENLHSVLRKPGAIPLCSLLSASQTLKVLMPAFHSSST